MGMIGGFQRITAAELDALLDDPDSVEELLFPEGDQSADAIDIDKAWHGLHFLLSADPWAGSGPLANVVMGGTEIGEDLGYGPARYLTVDETAGVAAALAALAADELGNRFDAQQFTANDIYPGIWDEGGTALAYLVDAYRSVAAYYADAAAAGDAMLKYLE